MRDAGQRLTNLSRTSAIVGLRLDVVELARLDQQRDAGPVFGPSSMTSEERVLAIENDRADGALDNVGVEFDASVVEEADEPFPRVQTITKFVGDPRLARDGRQLMLEPGPAMIAPPGPVIDANNRGWRTPSCAGAPCATACRCSPRR